MGSTEGVEVGHSSQGSSDTKPIPCKPDFFCSHIFLTGNAVGIVLGLGVGAEGTDVGIGVGTGAAITRKNEAARQIIFKMKFMIFGIGKN